MADWFKFYNDGLDSKGMQFAISEQPHVTSVWLVILSEASKNRTGKIKWEDQDFELIGFARKINVSVPIFNQSIGLLERIKYITREQGHILINGWETMQSDYANALSKGYYKNTRKILASNSLVSTVRGEESRGDQRRGDEKIDTKRIQDNSPPAPRFQKPSLEQISLQGAKIGLSEPEQHKFFNYYESNGWRVGKNPMKSWVAALTNWKSNARNYGQNNSKPNPRNAGVVIGPTDYGTAKPRLQREREAAEQQRMAGQMATDENNPSKS